MDKGGRGVPRPHTGHTHTELNCSICTATEGNAIVPNDNNGKQHII